MEGVSGLVSEGIRDTKDFSFKNTFSKCIALSLRTVLLRNFGRICGEKEMSTARPLRFSSVAVQV